MAQTPMKTKQIKEMATKDDIIARLRGSIRGRIERPSADGLDPLTYSDPLAAFIDMSRQMGCRVVEAGANDDLCAIIRREYPDAVKICSGLPEAAGCATSNPDTIPDARDLDGTDVGVVRGEFGVAENGCVWIPQTMKERAVMFISENLVVVLDRNEVVSNMHEAYRRVSINSSGYGSFISGPSKTADIAQVLVTGAQAARTLTLVLVDGPGR